MLKLLDDLINQDNTIILLYDIDKHFDNPIIVGYIKDLLSKIKNSSVTIISIPINQLVIKDFSNYVACINAPIPTDDEIVAIIDEEIKNYYKSATPQIMLDKNSSIRFVKSFKGLTERHIRNLVL